MCVSTDGFSTGVEMSIGRARSFVCVLLISSRGAVRVVVSDVLEKCEGGD